MAAARYRWRVRGLFKPREVHRKRPEAAIIKIMAGRNKTKARQKVPISPGLAEVLDELDSERKKLTSLHGASLVFTRDGKPISKNALRKAFESAKKQMGLKDFHFHDYAIARLPAGRWQGSPMTFASSPRVTPGDQFISAILTHRMNRWSRFSLNKWAGVVTTLLHRN
jgi:hypothetical protein